MQIAVPGRLLPGQRALKLFFSIDALQVKLFLFYFHQTINLHTYRFCTALSLACCERAVSGGALQLGSEAMDPRIIV